ncbi:MAG: ferritin family protein [Candidatus Anammoxibacter sp.]
MTNTENTEDTNRILQDIKSAIIAETISYEFYSKSSISVNLVSGMHAFREMMWEEEKHVKLLEKEYERLGGKGKVEYDPCKFGGLALPQLDIDAVTALDVAMKEESSSIKMYNDFLKRNKGAESCKLFEKLLIDEKRHLEEWDATFKNIFNDNPTGKEPCGEVYRFTKEDLEVIKTALNAEMGAFAFYNAAVNKIEIIDGMHAFQHIAGEERIHVKKLENEYYRLVKQKPVIEDSSAIQITNIKKDSDALVALTLAIKEEKKSLQRYLELEDMCTNTKLKNVIWELIESEWDHINQWRKIYKAIKEKNFTLNMTPYS